MTQSKGYDFGPVSQGGGERFAVLERLLRSLGKPKVSVLEVGSWTGCSALAWAYFINRHCSQKGSVLCIDLWEPYAASVDLAGLPLYSQMDDMLRTGEAFRLFQHNISLSPSGVKMGFLKGRLSEQMADFKAAGTLFDIVYIDGSHYLEDVREDLACARQLVAPDGILCGDDLEAQGDEVLLELAGGMACDYTSQGGPRPYHPGVTVAVWEAFGRVWSDKGAWAMKKIGDAFYQPFGE